MTYSVQLTNVLSYIHTLKTFASSGMFIAITSVIVLIILALLLRRSYYKLGFYGRHPFQTRGDFINAWSKDGVMNSDAPSWDKYCDIERVSFKDFADLSSKDLPAIVEFLNRLDDVQITQSIFQAALSSHNGPTFISTYAYDDSNTGSAIQGCLTSYPIKLTLASTDNNRNKLSTRFIDHIHTTQACKSKRDEITQKMFATHQFFMRSNKTSSCNISLFRSKPIWNLVPLCEFEIKQFKIDKTLDYNFTIEQQLSFFVAEASNLRGIIDLIATQSNRFDIIIVPELSNILQRIASGLMHTIGCTLNGIIIGTLVFQLSYKGSKNKGRQLELVSSVFDTGHTNYSPLLARACFSRALIMANKKVQCEYIGITSLSDNAEILHSLQDKQNSWKQNCISMEAYYLYNYRTSTKNASKCLTFI